MLWTVTLPAHHVPEAAVSDSRFKDLINLPPLISVWLEDGQWFVVLGASEERVWLRKLELHDREDQVKLGVTRRKLELVCTVAHNLHDLEGSEPFVRELGQWTRRFDVRGIHPDPVAYLDLRHGYVPAVIVQLELVLGFNEGSFGFGDSGGNPVAELIDGLVGRVPTIWLKTHPREAAGVRHERYLLRRGVDVVVVGKLGCWQELIPVVLFVAHEDTDELFELLVDAFGLTVSLQMVSGGGGGFDTDEAPQFMSELGDELWTTIGDVLLGGSVVPPDVPVIQPGSSDSTEARVALVEVGSLTEDVNHNHDRIEPMCLWKLDNEVHRDGIPALVWNLGQMKLTVGKSPERLRPVAHIAGSDVLADVSGQLGPPVVPGDQL
jgi:hypothetical protein